MNKKCKSVTIKVLLERDWIILKLTLSLMRFSGAWIKTEWWKWKDQVGPWCSAMMNYDLTSLTLFHKPRLFQRHSLRCPQLTFKTFTCTLMRMLSFTVHTHRSKRTQHTFREVLIHVPARAPVRMHKSALWVCLQRQVLLNLFTLVGLHSTTCNRELCLTI